MSISLRKAAKGKLKPAERAILLKKGLGPFLFEVEFWAQADKVRDHYLWRGPVDRQGKGFYASWSGLRFPAASQAWMHCRDEYPSGELQPTCGQKLCIRPSHQAVRSAG